MEYNFTDISTGFEARVSAVGASSGGNPLNKNSSPYGVYVKVKEPSAQYLPGGIDYDSVKIFQVVRQQIFLQTGKGKQGYLNYIDAALSDGKPALLYVNAPTEPVWGLDAPVSAPDYLPVFRYGFPLLQAYSVFFSDRPTPIGDVFTQFAPALKKYGITSGNAAIFFKTFIEYKGKVEVEIRWQGTASYDSGNTIDSGFTVTYVDWAKKNEVVGFQALLTATDGNKPSKRQEVETQFKAITGN